MSRLKMARLGRPEGLPSILKLSQQMVCELTENMYHPFTAFGLFCDNALNYGASFLKIAYALYDGKPMLVF